MTGVELPVVAAPNIGVVDFSFRLNIELPLASVELLKIPPEGFGVV